MELYVHMVSHENSERKKTATNNAHETQKMNGTPGITRDLRVCISVFSNLSSNHLTRLEESSFVGLSLLDELHIGNNRVSFIADGAFRGLTNLQMM